jgi:hypothetical protein
VRRSIERPPWASRVLARARVLAWPRRLACRQLAVGCAPRGGRWAACRRCSPAPQGRLLGAARRASTGIPARSADACAATACEVTRVRENWALSPGTPRNSGHRRVLYAWDPALRPASACGGTGAFGPAFRAKWRKTLDFKKYSDYHSNRRLSGSRRGHQLRVGPLGPVQNRQSCRNIGPRGTSAGAFDSGIDARRPIYRHGQLITPGNRR